MTAELNEELRGLGIYQARRKLQLLGLRVGNLRYSESPVRRLTVLGTRRQNGAVVDLELSGRNPVQNLPSIYQENDFLRRFLWVFQHLSYEVVAVLDNLHFFLTPMDAPKDFVEWMAGWFGLNLDRVGDTESARRLLQHAVVLYRWRGTVRGLKAMLRIITGTEPEIYENRMPYGPFVIAGGDPEAHILDRLTSKSYFTVFFPLEERAMDSQTVSQVYQVLRTEKPAHAQCFLTFRRPDDPARKLLVINDDTVLPGTTGMEI